MSLIDLLIRDPALAAAETLGNTAVVFVVIIAAIVYVALTDDSNDWPSGTAT